MSGFAAPSSRFLEPQGAGRTGRRPPPSKNFIRGRETAPAASDRALEHVAGGAGGDRIVGSNAANLLRGEAAGAPRGGDGFSETAGELRYVSKAGDVLVSGDVDGNGKADFSIFIDRVSTLDENAFIL